MHRPMTRGLQGRRPTRATSPRRVHIERRSGPRLTGRWSSTRPVRTRRATEGNTVNSCSPAPPRMPWHIAPARCVECVAEPSQRPGSIAPPTGAPRSSSSTRRAAPPTARSAATPAVSTEPADPLIRAPATQTRRSLIENLHRPAEGPAVVSPGRVHAAREACQGAQLVAERLAARRSRHRRAGRDSPGERTVAPCDR